MPKFKGGEAADPNFAHGKSMRKGFYDQGGDDRNIHKQLKGKHVGLC